MYEYIPEMIPIESKTAYFQIVLPKEWHVDNFKPVIIQIAGTGDQVCVIILDLAVLF